MKIVAKGMGLWDFTVEGEPLILDDTHSLSPEVCNGKILITHIPSPDIVVYMYHALAVVAETGGRLCHASVLALELGCPIIVAASGAREAVQNKKRIVLTCLNGEGYIYA